MNIIMDYMFDLKEMLVKFHFEHGTGGNPMNCIECVFTTLNEMERIQRERFKLMQEGDSVE